MPSFLDPLRMRSLFGGENTFGPPPMGNDLPVQGGFGGNMQPPPINPFGAANPMGQPGMESPDEYNVSDRMKELYTPEHDASDKLSALIDAYPQREKAGMLKKIATAIVGGIQGPQAALTMFDRPHQTAVEDWKNKVGPTSRAAELERGNNANERTLAYNTVAQELREQAQRHTEAKDAEKAKIAQQRADVYQYKAEHPNMGFNVKGPTVLVTDPATGKVTDTKIPTGNMSTLDKLHLQHELKGEEIEQKGDIDSRHIAERGDESRKTVETRGDEARKTKSTVSGSAKGAGNKDELPTQTRVRQFNAARQLWNTRPELRPFIKVGNPASNDFSVTPPGTNLFGKSTGPSAEQYKEIQDAVYGKGAIPINQPGRTGKETPGAPPAKKPHVPPATDDRVTVSKGGKKFSIPRAQIEQAKSKGYKLEP